MNRNSLLDNIADFADRNLFAEQYQKLKQVIQVTNPEIMKLRLGSEMKRGGSEFLVLSVISDEYVLAYNTVHGGIDVQRIDTCLIIGRPIRLADVLLALQSSKIWIGLDDSGAFVQFDASKPKTCSFLGINWNLSNDNLDHQSEETKQFLIDLLIQPS